MATQSAQILSLSYDLAQGSRVAPSRDLSQEELGGLRAEARLAKQSGFPSQIRGPFVKPGEKPGFWRGCMQAMDSCKCRAAYNRLGTHSHAREKSKWDIHGIGCRCVRCWKRLRRLYSFECYRASCGRCWTCSRRRDCFRCNRRTYMSWGDCLDSDCFKQPNDMVESECSESPSEMAETDSAESL